LENEEVQTFVKCRNTVKMIIRTAAVKCRAKLKHTLSLSLSSLTQSTMKAKYEAEITNPYFKKLQI
jgi:hypothetical protein